MNHLPSSTAPIDEDALLRRVAGEFLEMPGMRLTIAQAKRLWQVDAVTALRLFENLVGVGFLRVSGNLYQRAYTGRPAA